MDVAEALKIHRRLEDQSLASSPLSAMAEWVASGDPPPAVELRARGLVERPSVTPEAEFGLRLARKSFIRTWGFSIPCAEAVEALRALSPLVELGAGTGCWSALLNAAGVAAVATDPIAAGDVGYGFEGGRHAQVQPLSAGQAIAAHPDRDVFCSWPTQDSPWALGAAFQLRPGRRLALVEGSNTGTRGLRRYLATRFDLLSEIAIPQFPGSDDRLRIYRKA